jgi:hypothetical protein
MNKVWLVTGSASGLGRNRLALLPTADIQRVLWGNLLIRVPTIKGRNSRDSLSAIWLTARPNEIKNFANKSNSEKQQRNKNEANIL